MIRSMTGYASNREQINDAMVTLEIKTLNHKGFDFHYHSSRTFSMLEIQMREECQQHLRRGRIEIFFRSNKPIASEEIIRPNLAVAKQYLDAAALLTQEFNLSGQISVQNLMTLDDVLDSEETESSPEECWNLTHALITRSFQDLLGMKQNEGARLKIELESLLDKLEEADLKVDSLRDTAILEYREKLLNRIKEWEVQMDLDENRIIQEVAFFCDRADIQEETVRLKSHIEQFREILNENTGDASYQAVGRRLDFLCQEMFREVNTIGSKSSSLEIVRQVLNMKGIIEQIREQVQNIE
ncbi:MAG: YicC/YloC family endoribonuclease [bacterium]|jgi:uncharacterized protein (TIGR00255 family)|nr:YicC/YloC family endoribonuclease [bacterium]